MQMRQQLDYDIFVRECEIKELNNANRVTPGGPAIQQQDGAVADEQSDGNESEDEEIARQVQEMFEPIKLEVLDFTIAVLRDSIEEIKKPCNHKQQQEKVQVQKPSKCDSGHTMHSMSSTKPRMGPNEDFLMGEDISCKACREKIVIADGYYSCYDICDFDVHSHCYGGEN